MERITQSEGIFRNENRIMNKNNSNENKSLMGKLRELIAISIKHFVSGMFEKGGYVINPKLHPNAIEYAYGIEVDLEYYNMIVNSEWPPELQEKIIENYIAGERLVKAFRNIKVPKHLIR